MICLVSESAKQKLKFVKEQSDQYFIYDGDVEVGICYCSNYHSSPKNRIWQIRIEVGTTIEQNTAYSISEAKKISQEMYETAIDKEDRWNASMAEDISG